MRDAGGAAPSGGRGAGIPMWGLRCGGGKPPCAWVRALRPAPAQGNPFPWTPGWVVAPPRPPKDGWERCGRPSAWHSWPGQCAARAGAPGGNAGTLAGWARLAPAQAGVGAEPVAACFGLRSHAPASPALLPYGEQGTGPVRRWERVRRCRWGFVKLSLGFVRAHCRMGIRTHPPCITRSHAGVRERLPHRATAHQHCCRGSPAWLPALPTHGLAHRMALWIWFVRQWDATPSPDSPAPSLIRRPPAAYSPPHWRWATYPEAHAPHAAFSANPLCSRVLTFCVLRSAPTLGQRCFHRCHCCLDGKMHFRLAVLNPESKVFPLMLLTLTNGS